MSWVMNDKVEVSESGEFITCKGDYGGSLKHYILKRLGSPSRCDIIFTRISVFFGLVFRKCFIIEVIELLKDILSKRGSLYGVNRANLKELVSELEKRYTSNGVGVHDFDFSIIDKKMKFKVMDHQQEVFRRYREIKEKFHYRGMLLFGGAGVGKTASSLMLSEVLLSEKVVIISPKQVLHKVWVYALEDQVYRKPQDYYIVNESKHSYTNHKFILSTYENIDKLIELIPKINSRNTTVIVDESHNFGDIKSNRTNLLIDFIDKLDSNNNILMSGTPVKSGLKELPIILTILDREFKGKTAEYFNKLYRTPTEWLSDMLQKRFGITTAVVTKDSIKLDPVITSYVNVKLKNGDKYTLDNIRTQLREYIMDKTRYYKDNFKRYEDLYKRLYTYSKELGVKDGNKLSMYKNYENNVELLKKYYIDKQLMLHTDLMKEVNNFEETILLPYLVGEQKKEFREAKTIVKYLLLKIQGEALANVVMRARIEAHRDMATELNYKNILNSTEKKTIIFSNYVEVCDAVTNIVTKNKYKPITVYGNTTKDLNTNVGIFTNKKEINPLVTTFKSLSTGVPLIAANVLLVIDMPFRMYVYEQAVARVWRLGQDSQVTVYILKLDTEDKPNINSRNIDIISFFKEEVEKITGIPTSIDLGDIDKTVISKESLCDLLTPNSLTIEHLDPIVNNYQILSRW